MTRIKVCGITSEEDARMVAGAGVDAIGLNFWPTSKRYIAPTAAAAIEAAARSVNPEVVIVGLFVNPTEEEVASVRREVSLDWVQLHGSESPEFAASLGAATMKAMPITSEEELQAFQRYSCPWMLVDSKSAGWGGSGHLADWRFAEHAARLHSKLWLAGGLTPENVADAISAVRPYGVDVASGVEESPGKKDAEKTRQFVANVRGMS